MNALFRYVFSIAGLLLLLSGTALRLGRDPAAPGSYWTLVRGRHGRGPAITLESPGGEFRRVLAQPDRRGEVLSAAWSPDPRALYLLRLSSPANRLYHVQPGRPRPPTEIVPDIGVTADGTVFIAPDGRSIVYVRVLADDRLALFRADAAGRNPRHLFSPAAGAFANFSFSPDSRYLYFSVVVAGRGSTYRVPLAGGAAQTLASAPLELTWSPDGRRVAAVMDTQVVVMDAAGGNIQPVTEAGGFWQVEGWLPGDWLIVRRNAGGDFETLYRVRPDGRDFSPLLRTHGPQGAMQLSPDGRRVAFFASDEYEQRNLYQVEVASLAATLVSPAPGEVNRLPPQWSPDGEWLVFSTINQTRYELFRVRPDGRGLSSLAAVNGLLIAPAADVKFTPDGRSLMLSYLSLHVGTEQKARLDLEDGTITRLGEGRVLGFSPLVDEAVHGLGLAELGLVLLGIGLLLWLLPLSGERQAVVASKRE